MSRYRRYAGAVLVMLAVGAAPAAARTVTVEMRNKGADGFMVFQPALVEAQPGDTILFKAVDVGHDVQTIDGMLPVGAPALRSPLNKDYAVTVKTAGLYGVKCTPHFGMGMVALIRVGSAASSNLAPATAAAAKLPGLARKRMAALIARMR